jgi:AraC-like DNA-binding protein
MRPEATVNLDEIGFLVGFSDPSNFHRAFRRWTGQTPGEYRRARGSLLRERSPERGR